VSQKRTVYPAKETYISGKRALLTPCLPLTHPGDAEEIIQLCLSLGGSYKTLALTLSTETRTSGGVSANDAAAARLKERERDERERDERERDERERERSRWVGGVGIVRTSGSAG